MLRTFPTALLALVLASQAVAEDVRYPAGSHVGLVPPPGMESAKTFPGFEDRERKVAILINELPGAAYEEFLKSMNSGAISIPGVSNAKREILLIEGGAAHLVTGDQEAEGVKFKKWLLITRRSITGSEKNLNLAFVVAAQVPEEASGQYSDAVIRKSLSTIALRATVPVAEVLDQMPFRLSEMGGFESAKSLVPGRALMLSDGQADIETSNKPYLMISVGGGAPSQAQDRANFAQNVLRNIQGFNNLKLTNSEPLRIGGQPGHEIRLEGQSVGDGRDVVIVQWIRFAGTGFLRLVGVSPKDQWTSTFARFRAVRDGIEIR